MAHLGIGSSAASRIRRRKAPTSVGRVGAAKPRRTGPLGVSTRRGAPRRGATQGPLGGLRRGATRGASRRPIGVGARPQKLASLRRKLGQSRRGRFGF